MNTQCYPDMQIYIITRFRTQRADVEFSRVVAYTNVSAGGPPGRNVVETYIVTICAQCVKAHVIGTCVLPIQQPIPLNAGAVDNSPLHCFKLCNLIDSIKYSDTIVDCCDGSYIIL